jgi:hypothetical protein
MSNEPQAANKDIRYVRFVWCVVLTRLAFETLLVTGSYAITFGIGIRLIPGIVSGTLELCWIFAAYRMHYMRLRHPKSGPENYQRWIDSKGSAWNFFTETMGS